MWQDFKKFAFKGNVIDMAVGVVIGGAFGKIVTSLVNDIIMPLIGKLINGVDFKDMKWVLTEAQVDADGVVTAAENAVLYGSFLMNIIDFFIIAFSVFLFVRMITKAREKMEALKKKEEEPAPAPAPEEPKGPTTEELLAEIRDLLKEKK